jgi:hypothetical protein
MMAKAEAKRARVKREVLIDRQLHEVLEDLALESNLTADKLAEFFIFWGIMQLSSFAELHRGGDPVRDFLEAEEEWEGEGGREGEE